MLTIISAFRFFVILTGVGGMLLPLVVFVFTMDSPNAIRNATVIPTLGVSLILVLSVGFAATIITILDRVSEIAEDVSDILEMKRSGEEPDDIPL